MMCADIFTPEKRSEVMGKIKGKDTKPELIVRSLCHRLGYRFRLHRKDLPGTPDLVFPKFQLCVFVHGCFWHRHNGCRYAYQPKSRPEFWLPKLEKNTQRDQHSQEELRRMGWTVEVVWECETKNILSLEARLVALLNNSE